MANPHSWAGWARVVTAAELLAMAAFMDGKYAQAFPSFGSERMGAPVVAFCRVAEGPHPHARNGDAP